MAQVLSVDHERRRYEIRLGNDNSVKKVKAENVTLATGRVEAQGNIVFDSHISILDFQMFRIGGKNVSLSVFCPLRVSCGCLPSFLASVMLSLNLFSDDGEGGVLKGTRIELKGLKTAASLNGERAIVLSKDKDSDRYEIRMECDGSTKKKLMNMRARHMKRAINNAIN